MTNITRPDPSLLFGLCQQLGIDTALSTLADAGKEQPDSLPVGPWVRDTLKAAGIVRVASAILNWRRFDLRRLPALIWYQESWWLVTPADSGLLQLQREGETLSKHEDEIQDAVVLWLKPQPHSALSSLSAVSENLAAKLVWENLFRQKGWLWKVALATVVVNVLAVTTSLFAMQVYDRVVPTLAYATLTTLVAGMAMVMVMDWVLKTARARIIDSLACAVDKQVSESVFDHLIHLRIDSQPQSLGNLAAQVNSLDAVRQFFSSGIIFGLIDLPFALFFIAMIGIIGGQIGWVYALVLPIAVLVGLVCQWRVRDLMKKHMMRSNERQGLLVDAIRGAESIRASNASWRFAQEWRDISESMDGYQIRQKAIASFSTNTTALLSSIAYVTAIVVGVWQIEAGSLTTGGLIACSILGGRIIAPIAQSVQYLMQWQQVSQSLQMVHGVLVLPRERRDEQHLVIPDDAPNRIQLNQVRYAYDESPVKQIDIEKLTFNAGDRVLLVGSIGCGKSTLLKSMAGLYRPKEGRIQLGDADLWELDPQMVSAYVGYLPQTPHLFKGTLRSNLGLSGNASDSAVLNIAKGLGIDQIAASHPQGMDLPISEGGEGLSGGQRQMVALGRTLLERPRIWLLDEPTASLDAESENRVWKTIEATLEPEDIVVIATHKPLAATHFANRVIVMHQGRVVKDGKPGQVLPSIQRPAPPKIVTNKIVRQGIVNA